MRLRQARIAPLGDMEMTDEHRQALATHMPNQPLLNVFRTFARAPKALIGFNPWGEYILSKRNTLAPRDREIVILRVGFLCKSGYEFTQHTRMGLAVGLTLPEIADVKKGPTAPSWSAADAALIRMTDELVKDHFVGDQTWSDLSLYFTEPQRMDAVYTAGQYTQVAMFVNTFGVQLEEGQTLDPDLIAY